MSESKCCVIAEYGLLLAEKLRRAERRQHVLEFEACENLKLAQQAEER